MELYKIDHSIFKSINDKLIEKKDIRRYVYDLIEYIGLEDYLEKACISKNIDFFAVYDFEKNKLIINYEKIIEYALALRRIYDIDLPEHTMINYYLINAVIHEMEHAYQNFIIQEGLLPISPLLEYEFDYFAKNEEYDDVYDLITFEREAEINACENVLKLNQQYSDNNKSLMKFYLRTIRRIMVTGYKLEAGKVISPMKILCTNHFKIDTPGIEGCSEYEKMKLGFDVELDTYDLFKRHGRREIRKELLLK